MLHLASLRSRKELIGMFQYFRLLVKRALICFFLLSGRKRLLRLSAGVTFLENLPKLSDTAPPLVMNFNCLHLVAYVSLSQGDFLI